MLCFTPEIYSESTLYGEEVYGQLPSELCSVRSLQSNSNTTVYVGVTIFALCGPVGVLVGFEATRFLSATGVGIFDRGRERHVLLLRAA